MKKLVLAGLAVAALFIADAARATVMHTLLRITPVKHVLLPFVGHVPAIAVWGTMIAVFGLLVGAARRRRSAAVSA